MATLIKYGRDTDRPSTVFVRRYCTIPGCPDRAVYEEEVDKNKYQSCEGHHKNLFDDAISSDKYYRFIGRL
jgi:hypothetical protein